MMESDCEYFRRRAREEREAGMRSPNVDARRTHMELAERYDAAVAMTSERMTLTMSSAPRRAR